MPRMVLHIGTEKTGSSSIQRMMARNRELLRRDYDIAYSRPLGNVLCRLAQQPENRKRLRRRVDQLIEENAGPFTWVCSAELLQSRLTTDADVLALRRELESRGFDRFQIIVYLRRPAAIANSMASTAVQWDRERLQAPFSSYLDVVCDHRATLQRWGDVFGRESLAPRRFERSDFPDGSLLLDFLDTLGIADPAAFQLPPVLNAQISHTGIDIMHHVNDVLAERHRDMDPKAQQRLRQFIYRKLIEKNFTSPKYSQPAQLWEHYDRAFADSNEWVRQEFFPDLAAPMFPSPVPPPATSSLMEPDLARSVAQALVSASVHPVLGVLGAE